MEKATLLNKEVLEKYIVSWNLRFRYDRAYRKKYNIPFGSKEHREANQIDIYLDILEDRYLTKLQQEYQEKRKSIEDYKKTGQFLKESISSQEEDDALFKKARFR